MAKAMTVADYLSAAIDISGKTQKEVANEAGYTKANFLSMMKTGVTKVPIDKVPALARACGVDAKHFLRLALNEYMPDTWEVIQDTLNTDMLTKDEQDVLNAYRKVKDTIPPDAYSDGSLDIAKILKVISNSES